MWSVERYIARLRAGADLGIWHRAAGAIALVAVTSLLAPIAPAQPISGGEDAPELLSPPLASPEFSRRGERKLDRFRQQVTRSANAQKLVNAEALDGAYDEHANRASVIVMLRTDAAPPVVERFETPQARRAWQEDVASLQERTIQAVSSGDMTVRTRYQNIPAMACEVTSTGLQALLADPNVEHVQMDTQERRMLAQGIPLMGADGVRSTFDGSGMTIAIIDDGVDYTHPNLGGGGFPNSKVIGGVDTAGAGDADPYPGGGNTHGTSVAGIACGDIPASPASDYIGGMAPGARVAAVKVFGDGSPTASNSDVIEGIDWCVTNQYLDPANPIMVINMSLGGGQFFSAAAAGAADAARLASVEAAVAAGITVLAASGNDGYCDSMGVPAALEPVISVGAVYDAAIGTVSFCVDSGSCFPSSGSCGAGFNVATQMTTPGLVTAYSNTASFLDVLGASHSAYTPETGTGYDSSFGGTSAATPYVAGAVALIQAAALAETGSYLPPETIRTILVNTGTPITDTKGGGLTPGITKPLVDVEAAYLSFASGNPIQDIDVPESSLSYFLPVAGTEVAGFNIANQADVGGLDLNFDIVTNGVGADVEDTIGGPNFVVSGSNVSFGNIFQVTQDTTLKEIQSGLSFTGSAELTFEVFEMPGLAPSDLKARIFSTSGIFNGVGGALYTSGPISVDLQAGYYYAIATAWGTPTINHFLDLNPQPAVSFGNKVLAFLFNAPLPGLFTGDLGSTTYNLYQELTVEGESWLSVDVPTGMVAPQGVQPIIVTADMTGFAPGTYEGDVSVLSNDPDEGLVVLPVGVLVGAQGQVYVDFEHIGVEVGSMLSPYNTLAEGLTAVQSGGTVSILGAGTSDEVLDVSQDVTIESVDGEATIGDSPPIAVSTPEGEGLASPATLSTAASGPNAIPLDVPSSPPAIPSEQVSVMNAVPAE